ncbi:hypothetical protein L596_023688 [Steinernema carpocapsae]|uniref:Uncharacterized protein n=1 Tax=Steinernema carpocapsae TaxID=34508 RepID=A0A4U5MEM4_STECR|nr:hypothetical protein L596_023688 [Steinernema carpocapsae]
MHPFAALLILLVAESTSCLSDRVIADICLPRHELVEAVYKSCFEKASDFTFGGSCSGGFHSEITYSCKEKLPPKSYFEFLLPVLDEYRHDLRVSVLKNMVLDLSTLVNTEKPEFFMDKHFYIFKVFDDVEMHLSGIQSTMTTPKDEWNCAAPTHPNATLLSRQFEFSQLKYRIQWGNESLKFMENRTLLLVNTIGRLVRGEPVEESGFNEFELREFVRRYNVPRFPELKQDLEEFYMDLTSKTTPGILPKYLDYLGEVDAGRRLLSQYKQIFQKGQISFEYLDSKENDFHLSAFREPAPFWTDRLVVSRSPLTAHFSQDGCLPVDLLLSYSNRRCQKSPVGRYFKTENTSDLFPEKINVTLSKPCDSKKTLFKEVNIECRFPQQSMRLPDSTIHIRFYQRYFVAVLERYAAIVGEYSKTGIEELRNDSRIQAIEERLKLPDFALMSNDHLESFDPLNYLSVYSTFSDYFYEGEEAFIGSRESVQNTIKGTIRRTMVSYRAKALARWAMQLIRGEPISADELKYYDGESVRMLLSRLHMAPYDDKQEILNLLRDFYVDYAKDHTIAIGRSHLDFLSEPESHLKLAHLFRKIFTFGHVDTSYVS